MGFWHFDKDCSEIAPSSDSSSIVARNINYSFTHRKVPSACAVFKPFLLRRSDRSREFTYTKLNLCFTYWGFHYYPKPLTENSDYRDLYKTWTLIISPYFLFCRWRLSTIYQINNAQAEQLHCPLILFSNDVIVAVPVVVYFNPIMSFLVSLSLRWLYATFPLLTVYVWER